MEISKHTHTHIKAAILGFNKTPIWLENQESTNILSSCGSKFDILHSMSRKKGRFIYIRHNDLRDLTASMLSEMCKNTEIEPKLTPLSGEQLQGRTSNNSNEARVDSRNRGFWERGGQQAFFDFASDALQFTPSVLHQMKTIIKSHSPDKFLKDRSFSSIFQRLSKVSVAIVLDLFRLVFHGSCTKTLPVMQRKVMLRHMCWFLMQSKNSQALRQKTEGCRFILSWRYIIVVSFIRIAFVVVKLKVFKVLGANSASTNGSFWVVFGLLLPQIWFYGSILSKFSPDSSKQKH